MNGEKVALVFGASGGIGSAVCGRLLEKGWAVYGTYLSSKNAALELEKKGCRMVVCDARKSGDVSGAVDKVLHERKRLDALVYCPSGRLRLNLVEEIDDETFAEDLEVHFLGAVYASKKALPQMKLQKSGAIIFMLSEAIDSLPARMGSYAPAKSALNAFAGVAAKETARFGIRIISISPSFVETPLLEAFPPKLLEIERRKRGGSFLKPGDVAAVAVDALEEPGKYPSGSIVRLDSVKDVGAVR